MNTASVRTAEAITSESTPTRVVRAKAKPPRPPVLRMRPKAQMGLPAESAEILHDLNVDSSQLERHAVPSEDCTRTGRFIDVASGKVLLEQQDFALGSSVPLCFERTWVSCSTYRGPLGRGWHHAYDLALARGADTVGVRTADGRIVWLPSPRPGSSSYVADERMTLARDKYGYVLRDAAGTEHKFVPHRAQAAFVLAARRTREGQELRFAYDHRARLVRIADRRGLDLELDYDAQDHLVEIRTADPMRADKTVVLVRFSYDPRENLRKACDALGQARRYGYERGLLVKYDDRNGCATQFEWDGPESTARCVHTWIDAGLRDRKLEYQEGRTRVRNSLGQETSFAHDGMRVQRVVDAAGGVRDLAYDPGGRLEREVDALGHERRCLYDARGNLLELRSPDGASYGFEYDARDRLHRAVDALGGAWELAYDGRGRLCCITDPLGNLTQFQHRGRWLVGVTDAARGKTSFAYDGAGNLAARTAPDSTTTRYTHDAWGRLTSIIDPHGNVEIREYDLLGRLVRVQEPDGNRCELAYDAEGNLVRRKDTLRDVRFTYQGTGQLSSRSEGGHTVCFEYDGEEQLIAILNEAGKLCRLRRGPNGEVVEVVGFDDIARVYVRDAAGRIVRIEVGDAFSEYEYDAAGRVLEVQHSDGAFEGYRYRADGALLSAWNQTGTLTFERDALGRLSREQRGEYWMELSYDAVGRCAELRSSFGTRLTLERDAAGRLRHIAEQASQLDSKIVRDALGLEIERSLIGGCRSAWQRDSFGQPTGFRLETAAGDLVRKVVCEWELGGRLRRCTDSQRGTTEYCYDAVGNLAWLRSGTGSYQLRMPDAVGNVFARDDRRDREYGPGGQLLAWSTRDGEVRCEYDVRGNLVERSHADGRRWKYVWSAGGLLQRVIDPDGLEVSFGYDALGRRSWKRARGLITHFVWAGSTLLHEWVEREGARPPAGDPVPDDDAPTLAVGDDRARGTREQPITWLHDPDTGWPFAKISAGGRFAIVTDHLGAPRSLVDENGRSVWIGEAKIGGELRSIEGDRSACLLRGDGLYEDLETGLYCGADARYVDPRAGTHICQGLLSGRPKLRGYAVARDSPRPSAAFEVEPPHTWFVRVRFPALAESLPPMKPPLPPDRPSEVQRLATASPGALVDRLFARVFNASE